MVKDDGSLVATRPHGAPVPSGSCAAVAADSAPRPLSVERILAWADVHHAAHGAWPAVGPGTVSGEVGGAPGESWKAINHALALGLRGLAGDSSLAELLDPRDRSLRLSYATMLSAVGDTLGAARERRMAGE